HAPSPVDVRKEEKSVLHAREGSLLLAELPQNVREPGMVERIEGVRRYGLLEQLSRTIELSRTLVEGGETPDRAPPDGADLQRAAERLGLPGDVRAHLTDESVIQPDPRLEREALDRQSRRLEGLVEPVHLGELADQRGPGAPQVRPPVAALSQRG